MKFILKKGTRRRTVTGGCYGCIGRTDSYYPYAYHDEIEAINERNGFEFCSDEYEAPGWHLYMEEPEYLELPSNFWNSEHDNGIEKLYHATRLQLLEYLVTRSPYSSCFKDGQTAESIVSRNKVVLNCQGVSSELVISLGYILRAMCKEEIVMNYKRIREKCPEMPEFVALVLSYVAKDLYRGTGVLSVGYSDGVLIPRDFSCKRIQECDPDLSGISISDCGGYVMNVSGMWRAPYSTCTTEGGDEEQDTDTSCYEKLRDLVNEHSSAYTVTGVFGDFLAEGIQDMRSFLLDVTELFKNSEV